MLNRVKYVKRRADELGVADLILISDGTDDVMIIVNINKSYRLVVIRYLFNGCIYTWSVPEDTKIRVVK